MLANKIVWGVWVSSHVWQKIHQLMPCASSLAFRPDLLSQRKDPTLCVYILLADIPRIPSFHKLCYWRPANCITKSWPWRSNSFIIFQVQVHIVVQTSSRVACKDAEQKKIVFRCRAISAYMEMRQICLLAIVIIIWRHTSKLRPSYDCEYEHKTQGLLTIADQSMLVNLIESRQWDKIVIWWGVVASMQHRNAINYLMTTCFCCDLLSSQRFAQIWDRIMSIKFWPACTKRMHCGKSRNFLPLHQFYSLIQTSVRVIRLLMRVCKKCHLHVDCLRWKTLASGLGNIFENIELNDQSYIMHTECERDLGILQTYEAQSSVLRRIWAA